MRTLSAREIFACAAQASRWIMRDPLRWFAIALAFLVFAESLMLVPYIGFILKMSAAAVIETQILAMLAASGAREAPRPLDLLHAFQLPLASQLVVVLSALVPFAAGILFLYLQGGGAAIAHFFGDVATDRAPDADVFFLFKCVMYVVAIPFAFFTSAVGVAKLTGWAAAAAGFSAARKNLLALAVSLALAIAFELALGALSSSGSLPGAILSIVSLVVVLAWDFAFSFALATRIFDAQDSYVIGERPVRHPG
jgi:hypothetical protein